MTTTIEIKTGAGVPTDVTAGRFKFDLTGHMLYLGDGSANWVFAPLASGLTPGTGQLVVFDENGHLNAYAYPTFDGTTLNGWNGTSACVLYGFALSSCGFTNQPGPANDNIQLGWGGISGTVALMGNHMSDAGTGFLFQIINVLTSSLAFQLTGDGALILQDCAGTAPAALAGGIYFDSTVPAFYKCVDGANWVAF